MSNTPNESLPVAALQPTPAVLQPVNPMDRDAMEFIYNLGCANRAYTVQDINGATYVNTDGLELVEKYERPAPKPFFPKTLSGLVEWLKADMDKFFTLFPLLYVHVSGIRTVEILSPIHGEKNERDILARCEIDIPEISFNKYMGQEDFIIMLQTRFVEGENRDRVAQVAGNLRMNQDAETADDGVSQRITVRDGVSSLKDAVFQNPVSLAPRRTFPEVEQPSSPFVLRFKKAEGQEAGVALFEADGGAWRMNAIETIGAWLKYELAELPVVIIA